MYVPEPKTPVNLGVGAGLGNGRNRIVPAILLLCATGDPSVDIWEPHCTTFRLFFNVWSSGLTQFFFFFATYTVVFKHIDVAF